MSIRTHSRHVLRTVLLCLLAASLLGTAAAVDTPTSYGEVAKVDTPILRIPLTENPPEIDGVFTREEWEDASALSGFWYDFAQAKFFFLAPQQTQLQLYAAHDRDHLYLCYLSPIYPENSWLKARARFPDVYGHPLYGQQWDDHVELELRPYEPIAKGFQLGLFKWFINPINTVADQYWSVNFGNGQDWQSRAVVRSGVTATRWALEIRVPLASMFYKNYTGKDGDGRPLVTLPPADGTAYRSWFTRGIGGNGDFYNAFDNHIWNTTKTKLVFDSQAPSFQVNELGPIMDDVIDLELTAKNHNTRSETVRIGFFVESEEGLVYSTYDAPELKDGLLELRPGEVQRVRIRKPFPGISVNGNVLWFDVRSAGRPAKVLFRTRLIKFHSMDGGATRRGEGLWSFRDRRLEVIAKLRPPRQDFDFRYELSTYRKRLFAVVDTGIHGASEEARGAHEAKLTVMKDNEDQDIVKEVRTTFSGAFATFLVDLPELVEGESYRLSLLLFDGNKRIVGERNPDRPLVYTVPKWQGNQLGLDDKVWEPFVAIRKLDDGFETLKHRFVVDASGLPAQIYVKPDLRELPLEARGAEPDASDAQWIAIGRGPQLRAPFRLELAAGGKRYSAKVTQPARLVRQWKSEFEYAAAMQAGPLDLELKTQYDCDGSLHCALTYGSDKPVTVSSLEMLVDVAGTVDMVVSSVRGGGMASADVWECTLPDGEGVVWNNAGIEMAELYYSRFLPWLWFGSADRGFSWFADSDREWMLDREGGTTTLERDSAGDVTWRVKFVNHETEVSGKRTITFSILTHPAKPKPENARRIAWLYRGGAWADEFPGGQLYKSDEDLRTKARIVAGRLSGLPRDAPDSELAKWGRAEPPYWRFYQLRNIGGKREERGTPEATPELDQRFEDKFVYWFERHVRIGRRHGWWWDETWPVYRSDDVAAGNAYLRDPDTVGTNELPWQAGYLTGHMRSMFKRLSRVFKDNAVPLRNYLWANNSATCFESFAWDTMLVEECGSDHRTFEVDNITQFPNSLYRYLCHNYSGLIARVVPGAAQAMPGDDKRLDRQYLGRALLNDIGVAFQGPHGNFVHREQAVRLINALDEFGFFEDQGTEVLPFWRNADIVRFGSSSAVPGVPVTVYRRPMAEGNGYKALIVVLNESDEPVQAPLQLLNAQRVLGGPNALTAGAVRGAMPVADPLGEWWSQLAARNIESIVLKDVETGDIVARLGGDAETYGPLYVPYHDYRLLYAEGGQ